MTSEEGVKSPPEEALKESSPKKERPKLTEQQKIENKKAISSIASSLREVGDLSKENVDFVVRVFERFGFVIDLDKSRHPEMIAIVFSVANEWTQGEMSNKKMFLLLDELLSKDNIFTSESRKHDKIRVMGYTLVFLKTNPELVDEVLLPELRKLNINVDDKDPADIFVGLEEKDLYPITEKIYDYIEANLAVNGIFEVPFEDNSIEIYTEAAKRLGTDLYHIAFQALAVRKNLIIIKKNASKITIAHEKNHIDNPGLVVGKFGYSINEAITEYLARVQVNPGINPASFRFLVGSYNREISLINKLRELNPKVVELMIASYRDDSKEVSIQFIKELVATIGLDGYLKLYMASPYVNADHAKKTRSVQTITSEVHKHIDKLKKAA